MPDAPHRVVQGEYAFQQIRYPQDFELMKRIYDTMLIPNFPPEELDPFSSWESSYKNPSSRYTLTIMAAFEKDDPEERIMGVLVYEYFKRSNSMLLTYLVLSELARGKGLGLKLALHSWIGMKALCTKNAHPEGPNALFVEVNDPRKVKVEDDVYDPADRVRMFQHMGVRQLENFEYFQPMVGRKGHCDLLLLGAIILPTTERVDGKPGVPAQLVVEFLYDFHTFCDYDDPNKVDMFQRMKKQLLTREHINLVNFDLPKRRRKKRRRSPKMLNSKSKVPFKVLVVGAGYSGLACARILADKGYVVAVVEARHRLGGRVYSGRSWDKRIDLGCSMLHGADGNPLFELSSDLPDVQMAKVDQMSTRFCNNRDGSAIDSSTVLRSFTKFQQLLEAVSKSDVRTRKSLQDCADQLWREEGLECSSQEERDMINFFLSLVENDHGASLSSISAAHYAKGGLDSEGDHVLVSGFHQLTEFLASKLQVYADHVVKSIEYNTGAPRPGRNVRVTCEGGDVLEADAVVITLPTEVLKAGDVQFDPPLPSWKTQALQNLGTGVSNKVVMRFEKAFWGVDSDFLAFHLPIHPETGAPTNTNSADINRTRNNCWIINDAAHDQRTVGPEQAHPLLTCVLSGDLAKWVDSADKDQVVEFIMQLLRRTFPDQDVKAPQDVQMTKWGQDPFSKMSYTYIPPGSGPEDVARYAEPVGPSNCQTTAFSKAEAKASHYLFFAGEGTSSARTGLVDGAYQSGVREAERIHAEYTSRAPRANL